MTSHVNYDVNKKGTKCPQGKILPTTGSNLINPWAEFGKGLER